MQSDYFQQLTHSLQQQGTGTPQLIVDMARFQHNLDYVAAHLPARLQPRLVVKSLACLEILQHASQSLNTQRFMLFHLPHLYEVMQHFPQADVLFGKPMPIRAVDAFYQQVMASAENIQLHLQWLVDQPARLQQYLHLAQQRQLCLNINIEIDIGLHRGGGARSCWIYANAGIDSAASTTFKTVRFDGVRCACGEITKCISCTSQSLSTLTAAI